MKILVTGANGYIGQRLLQTLLEKGHQVVALVRSAKRLAIPPHRSQQIEVVTCDLLNIKGGENLPKDIEAAYYLIHSLAQIEGDLHDLEKKAARNFLDLISPTQLRQVIYLGGLIGDQKLSPHLESRKQVENTLRSGKIPLTTLRAGIIIGSGSASFEIMRDLVEKLPVMVAPKWVKSLCQPISIADVLYYLTSVLDFPDCKGKSFDIGGPDILTYKEMLLEFAKIRGLKRWIISIPILTPRLSSYWLYFVTSTNFILAMQLVDSLKNDAICKERKIQKIFPRKCLSFKESLNRTFAKIEENVIFSSWKDTFSVSTLHPELLEYVQVPEFGCLIDVRTVPFTCDPDKVVEAIWSIGGAQGWYAMNWAWNIRGAIDRTFMGTGLHRGRTHPSRLRPGDVLDFWRVLIADKKQRRLLLYAEMRLPGEAWLEFRVTSKGKGGKGGVLKQKAIFRPNGVQGRLYWYGVYPFHWFVFQGMAKGIVKAGERKE